MNAEIEIFNDSWQRGSNTFNKRYGLRGFEKDIFNTLMDRCTEICNEVKCSTSGLSEEVGCCKKTVVNVVKRLISKGIMIKKDKASRTETNVFILLKSLPAKKRRKSVSKEQPAPSAEPEQIQPEPEKPKKKKYGNYGRVRLTDEEYSSLIADFGEEKVSEYIQKADDYSKDKNRWYNNNAQTIRQWLEEDNKPSQSNDNWYGYKTPKMRARKAYMMYDDVKWQEMEEIDEYLSLVNNFDELDE